MTSRAASPRPAATAAPAAATPATAIDPTATAIDPAAAAEVLPEAVAAQATEASDEPAKPPAKEPAAPRSTVIDPVRVGRRRTRHARVPAGVAAGHPATAETGLRVLDAGGSAADAAVSAVLACCVSESVMAGISGGGFATYYDAVAQNVTCLDFFCAVPGLDGDVTAGKMLPIEVSFGGVPQLYAIGEASIAIPGVPAGIADLHRRFGRLPWASVVAPAVELARSGVPIPFEQAHTLAMVAPAMTPGAGADIYSPNGRLLQGGDLLYHPGLDRTLQALADEGADAFYTGWIGQRLVEVVRAGGGAIGPADLAAYRVLDVEVGHATLAGNHVFARHDMNNLIPTVAALPAGLPGLPRGERLVAIADALLNHGQQRLGDTTNISVVDRDGNACVVTLTLGVGSGVWLPGLGVHLNSMLGEAELITGPLTPGERMSSNMCPLVVVDGDGELAVAAGSAGASRIRTALVHTLVNTLVDRVAMTEAINRPRVHVVAQEPAPVAHVEPGYTDDEVDALAGAGYAVHRWDHLSHYFGGASAVGHTGAAGDPRRGGTGLLL